MLDHNSTHPLPQRSPVSPPLTRKVRSQTAARVPATPAPWCTYTQYNCITRVRSTVRDKIPATDALIHHPVVVETQVTRVPKDTGPMPPSTWMEDDGGTYAAPAPAPEQDRGCSSTARRTRRQLQLRVMDCFMSVVMCGLTGCGGEGCCPMCFPRSLTQD